jgi:hypothetical protein
MKASLKTLPEGWKCGKAKGESDARVSHSLFGIRLSFRLSELPGPTVSFRGHSVWRPTRFGVLHSCKLSVFFCGHRCGSCSWSLQEEPTCTLSVISSLLFSI